MTLSEVLSLFDRLPDGSAVLKKTSGGTGTINGGDGTGKFILGVLSLNGIYQRFIPANTGTTALTSTSFPTLGSYTTLGSTQIPFACTIKNLYVTSVANASDGTDKVSVYKNGVITTLSCVVANSQRTGSDTTHTVTVNAGDYLSLSLVYDGAGNFNDWQANFELDPS